MRKPLRFHWRLAQAQDGGAGVKPASAQVPDLAEQGEFCRRAETCGIESVLTAFGYYMPDPLVLATALATQTCRLKFIVAFRPGLMSPTLLTQQVNTFAALSNGRVALNVVIGHSRQEQAYYGDDLDHDQRYARAGEFLSICRDLWSGNGPVNFAGAYLRADGAKLGTPFLSPAGPKPEIYVGGGSSLALDLARRYGDCLLQLGGTVESVRAWIGPILEQGLDAGLRFSMICRPTRREALAAAREVAACGDAAAIQQVFVKGSDSQQMRSAFHECSAADPEWLANCLWKGAVAAHGASAIALVGSPDEVASAIVEYRNAGISQFIFSGWPNLDQMAFFAREVLPIVRERERD
jgi:alkanesulfonate monooxygenase